MTTEEKIARVTNDLLFSAEVQIDSIDYPAIKKAWNKRFEGDELDIDVAENIFDYFMAIAE